MKNAQGSFRRRHKKVTVSVSAQGLPMVWLTGGMLALALTMVLGLLTLVLYRGTATFRPLPVELYETADGRFHMGEVTRTETFRPRPDQIEELPPEWVPKAKHMIEEQQGVSTRRLVRTGNFEVSGEHFNWVPDYNTVSLQYPEWAVVLERLTWGRFYGIPTGFIIGGETAANDPQGTLDLFRRYHGEVSKNRDHRRKLETVDIGRINHDLEKGRLRIKTQKLDLAKIRSRHGENSERYAKALEELNKNTARYEESEKEANEEYTRIRGQIDAINKKNDRYRLLMTISNGQTVEVPIAEIVRGYPANRINFFQKAGIYFDRWIEFFSAGPREANSEGGVFPAIFGTVVMTLIMSLLVVPFGVIAALYLREYAKAGTLVSTVRIAINNLAGVPSIVFGVFGLGFFCYLLGGSIDSTFFPAKLPNPTFGTGGILWSSLTLALLTLPVVIVATEEALAAVPGSMREGSYACGASKWQTIRRIVLPRAMPGIMTGMILAMARGAGEVAPLMLVGAVKLAPELPIDGYFPYVHLERSFMHLGFHIYDVGFQSQNSEAAIPMVFTTTLLLIFIIVILNVTAIRLRNRLRKKFVSSHF
jgi:phosphate transport system permease protein